METTANTSYTGDGKDLSLKDETAAYQVVGEVKAHQAYDGYLV